jgi:hypothetical protein
MSVGLAKEFCLNDDEGGVSLIPQEERLTYEFKRFLLNGDFFAFFFCGRKKEGRTARE